MDQSDRAMSVAGPGCQPAAGHGRALASHRREAAAVRMVRHRRGPAAGRVVVHPVAASPVPDPAGPARRHRRGVRLRRGRDRRVGGPPGHAGGSRQPAVARRAWRVLAVAGRRVHDRGARRRLAVAGRPARADGRQGAGRVRLAAHRRGRAARLRRARGAGPRPAAADALGASSHGRPAPPVARADDRGHRRGAARRRGAHRRALPRLHRGVQRRLQRQGHHHRRRRGPADGPGTIRQPGLARSPGTPSGGRAATSSPGAPTEAQIAQFTGRPAMVPVRVYAGLQSAPPCRRGPTCWSRSCSGPAASTARRWSS